jgi:hypothetical protein
VAPATQSPPQQQQQQQGLGQLVEEGSLLRHLLQATGQAAPAASGLAAAEALL